MKQEREPNVGHTTVYHWVQEHAFQVDTTGLLLTIVVLPANIQNHSSTLTYVS